MWRPQVARTHHGAATVVVPLFVDRILQGKA